MKKLSFLMLLFLFNTCYARQNDSAVEQGASRSVVKKVVVNKSERKLYLLNGEQMIKVYSIALGNNPVGHKQRKGDKRTPEGRYVINWRNANSKYHKALHISYPNEQDQANAAADGVAPGGQIMIHGRPSGWEDLFFEADWTAGCIAVNNDEIEEIWAYVKNGTPIEIIP